MGYQRASSVQVSVYKVMYIYFILLYNQSLYGFQISKLGLITSSA